MLPSSDASASDAIAIVGAACRLPGGITSPEELWQALCAGRDLIGEVPPDRFDAARWLDPDPRRPGKAYSLAGGFLDDVRGFDAGYFNLSPREAVRMDPQQRLLLEMAVEGLDNAGIDPATLAGSPAAVYVGASSQSFAFLQGLNPRSANAYTMTGGASCNIANRVSHFLDLRGPSLAVDTACSSSLVALHHACEALRTGRSPLALAAGVNILLSPFEFVGFAKASMLSPTGRCRPFSAGADGYVRAEGGGLVVLKPLAAALADGDRVQALILGSGVNTDGHTPGLAQPSPEAQEALLREVYTAAGIEPDELVYLEMHGTGTPVGDPVECGAVGRALGSRRTPGRPLPVGSVKSHLGHLEPASGMAGLLKTLQVLRHRRLPGNLHALPLNPDIDFEALGLAPATDTRPLEPTANGRAVAGVNSFGFGGANAHVVLASPPPVATPAEPPPGQALPVLVSGRTKQAAAEAARRLADRLEGCPPEEFYDLAYTAGRRRGRHQERIAVLAPDPATAARRLRELAAREPAEATPAAPRGSVAFVFSGNGAQWTGMGAELLREDAEFRTGVAEADAALRPLLGWSVRQELATPGRPDTTDVAQPLQFAVQVGLVAMLRAQGITPAAVTGHSSGEMAAAWAAGALGLATAARVVVARSRAQATTVGDWGMAALGTDPAHAQRLLEPHHGRLEIAGINSARDVTISGDRHALAELGEYCAEHGLFFRRLALDHAFHSRAMDGLEDTLLADLTDLKARRAQVPYASATTGTVLSGTELDARYWWDNLRRPVLFAAAVAQLTELGCDMYLEIGPHPVLCGYLRRLTGKALVLPTLSREHPGQQAVHTAAARLLAGGVRHDHRAFFPRPGRVVDLPPYPWQREAHWNAAPTAWAGGCGDGTVDHPLLGERAAVAEPVWHGPFDPARAPYLTDHRIGQSAVMPAAGYIEMMLAAGRRVMDAALEITNLTVTTPLVLPFGEEDRQVQLQTALSTDDGLIHIAGRGEPDAPWQQHARARLRRLYAPVPELADLDRITAGLPRRRTAEEHYRLTRRTGLRYGPAFQVLRGLRTGDGEVLAEYAATASPGGPETGYETGYEAHPALLDGALQAGAALLEDIAEDGVPFVPVSVARLRAWRRMPAGGHIHVRSRARSDREVLWDITVLAPSGLVCLSMEGCRLRRFEQDARRGLLHTTVARAAPRPGPATTPAPLPPPAETAAACAGELARLDADHRAPAVLRELTAHFGAAAVAALLGDDRTGTFTVADLHTAPGYDELLELLLRTAHEHGLAEPVDGGWRLLRRAAPLERFRAAAEECPGLGVELALLAAVTVQLVEVLRGHRDPAELLAAETNRPLLEELRTDGPLSGYANRAAAAVLDRLLRHWPAGRPLRVLELGAGTGGATSCLLPLLPPDRTRYVYADRSAARFPRAQRRFTGHDFISYRVLDPDRDPAQQGWTEGDFDLVIAVGSLTATRDLPRALGHLARLLDDGGQLLAVAPHDPAPLALLTALPPAYWERQDTGARPDGPLPTADGWRRLLAEGGWQDPVVLGEQAGGTVLLAGRPEHDRPADEPPGLSGGWLIAAEPSRAALASVVGERLAAAGGRVHQVAPSTDADYWSTQLARAPEGPDVLLLLGADDPAGHTALLRALAMAAGPRTGLTLWLVTPPTGALPAPEPPTAPATAAAWGVARCLAAEHPDIRVRRISLEPAGRVETDADRLAAELTGPDEEDEVLLGAAGRFVTRLRPGHDPRPAAGAPAFALRLSDPGRSYRLDWVPAKVPEPGPEEVVVEVRAAGLNYRDVLQALGSVPLDPEDGGQRAGMECAGVITAVGSRVTQLAVGDRVFAFGSGTLRSHVALPAATVGRIPGELDFTAAATLPVVLLTVHHALHHLARLAPGETVLVHGGAGGVGLAAVHYVRQAGAQVIATAGTPAKRELLRLLGVRHVLDSRTLGFADRIRELTGGRGVDVVLNSLAGEAISRGLEVLRPGGRFIELGKRDLYADSRLPMGPFLNNLTFCAADLAQLARERPGTVAAEFAEVAERVRERVHRPIAHHVYPAARVAEAFEALQHSRHIGKVVISLATAPPVRREPGPLRLDPRATYLVTGGLGGFGAATARRLAERGARRLCLVGRRGADSPEAPALLEELNRLGVTATAHAADVTDEAAMAALLASADTEQHPLRGIVHAAAVFDDRPLTGLDEPALRRSLDPKAGGALLLDRLTRERQLDFFVVYSSVSALFGNQNQANYAAANLMVEALVRSRRRAGRPALAVAWGALGDAGHVARNRLDAFMTRIGLAPVPAGQALDALEGLLAEGAGGVVTLAGIDWAQVRHGSGAVAAPRFALVRPEGEDGDGAGERELALLLARATPEEALAAVTGVLVEILAGILQTSPELLTAERPLAQLGLDSLMGAELMTAIHRRLGCNLPAVEIINSATVGDLAQRCVRRLGAGAR
ncbi:SDR family NAD(P)-dependent oxidoreductase [Streptomyces sp. NPDC052396]|uniref:SDR family NAD(P)-dependent oxidoreductase n=1 Tax=Streptomyces sp. NPDC052396 TaxID=3365689 RepID=UPI0037CD9D24